MKLKVGISIGLVRCNREDEIEIPDDEWVECKTDQERDTLCANYHTDWMNERLDCYWEIID